MKLLLAIAAPLYALDQATKWWIQGMLEEGMEREIVPGFFWLVHLHNTGAAFSVLSNRNGFFLGLSALALVVVTVLAWRGAFHSTMSKVAGGLLLSGIAGNLTDRILHSHVVDFLLFDLHVRFASPWPAFNVADSCICVAAVLFVVESIFSHEKPASAAEKRGG